MRRRWVVLGYGQIDGSSTETATFHTAWTRWGAQHLLNECRRDRSRLGFRWHYWIEKQ